MDISRIHDMDVRGKRLLVRADLNVPVDGDRITDATRIERFAAGMKPLLARGARLVILTHFGRPDPQSPEPEFSVGKLCPALSDALGVPVRFAETCTGEAAETQAALLRDGEVLLCENLRFDEGEAANDPGFAARLARLGDIYVNDAFSCAHRAHASTHAITRLLPSAAGPLLIEEIEALSAALEAPRSPAVAIVGGAKVSSKIAVLKNLVGKLDAVIIGGGMANTFLFADGAPMGKSLHEADQIETVAEIRALAAKAGCRLVLPTDCVGAREFAEGAEQHVFAADECPDDMMILDAGPHSLAEFEKVVAGARTILWNGPLGAFEVPPFDRSTVALAQKAARATRAGSCVSVAGGGDTVAALNVAGVADDFTYVSSAGGAFLEWLEGKALPGIAALMQATKAA
ncbi:phosphoglycerate kinase [Brevirhabdus pacifica]|uniref:Phosphoglycerate kinase n=1 Tax=Brevirhabdus pacifica TaxID=1267768 RepID=A0A1U7DJ41_9RHOB|nr:phosphoglycerate kinase [Brevirhabdus pacifica]APX90002.1 phosphoglycerate kinase [Brevirhabdus pacifica]OWU75398.1 phosphoglycerate kinase [Loktanella sp. 22II-4b]